MTFWAWHLQQVTFCGGPVNIWSSSHLSEWINISLTARRGKATLTGPAREGSVFVVVQFVLILFAKEIMVPNMPVIVQRVFESSSRGPERRRGIALEVVVLFRCRLQVVRTPHYE